MTVYVVTVSNYHCEDNTLTEVYAHREDAIARLHDLYIEACADPEITEQRWNDTSTGCCPSCAWFDYRASWEASCAWIMERELL